MADDPRRSTPAELTAGGKSCGENCGCGRGSGGAPTPATGGVSRRSFIKTLGASAAVTSLSAAAESRAGLVGDEAAGPRGPELQGPDPVEVTLRINGKDHTAAIDPSTTLLEALRIHVGLTGTKEVCDRGACGACSVMLDGKVVNSCMMLALDAAGSEITTVEGLVKDGKLDPVQEQFVRHDAMQCGYCTPGFVVAARALLNENPKPTLEQIRKGLGGNICRCGQYSNIFNAVLEASGQPPIMDQKGV